MGRKLFERLDNVNKKGPSLVAGALSPRLPPRKLARIPVRSAVCQDGASAQRGVMLCRKWASLGAWHDPQHAPLGVVG